MRRLIVFLGLSGALAVALSYACGSAEDCDFGRCTGAVPGEAGPTGDGNTNPDGQVAPPTCEPSKDATCVSSTLGVFVDSVSGKDENDGSKEKPVQTIGEALKKLGTKQLVYICDGTYPEHVKLTTPVSLVGGFKCGSWQYDSSVKPQIAPTNTGYALHIEKATSTVSDLTFTARDAAEAGASSIAIFTSENSLTLRRVNIRAGKGLSPTQPAEAGSNARTPLLGNGITATTGAAAPPTTCNCAAYGQSEGGGGGGAGVNAGSGSPGTATPSSPPIGTRTADGGTGNMGATVCSGGNSGTDGIARKGGSGPSVHGTLTATGWQPAAGGLGEIGNPGVGGGGGGGSDAVGGGAGGCGGCGGGGGNGGGGGGGSIGIAAFETTLTLDMVDVTCSDAANGGTGTAGGTGGAGGTAGGGGCGGGRAGNGAGGGGGGGGAGGVSVAIVHKGGAINGTVTAKLGAFGPAGVAGPGGPGGTNILSTAPSGADGGAGLVGVAKDVLTL